MLVFLSLQEPLGNECRPLHINLLPLRPLCRGVLSLVCLLPALTHNSESEHNTFFLISFPLPLIVAAAAVVVFSLFVALWWELIDWKLWRFHRILTSSPHGIVEMKGDFSSFHIRAAVICGWCEFPLSSNNFFSRFIFTLNFPAHSFSLWNYMMNDGSRVDVDEWGNVGDQLSICERGAKWMRNYCEARISLIVTISGVDWWHLLGLGSTATWMFDVKCSNWAIFSSLAGWRWRPTSALRNFFSYNSVNTEKSWKHGAQKEPELNRLMR